jgi:hypothetical protein
MLIPPQALAESDGATQLIKIERQPNSKSSAKVATRGIGTCRAQPGQTNRKNGPRFHRVSEIIRAPRMAFPF